MNLSGNGNKMLHNCQLRSEDGIPSSLPSSAVSTEDFEDTNADKIKLCSIETSPFVLPLESNCRKDDKSKSRYFPHFENKRAEREGKDGKHCCFNSQRNLDPTINESWNTIHFKAPYCGIRKRKYSTQDESQHWSNRNIVKNISDDGEIENDDNNSKRLKSCDNYECSVLTTTNDKVCYVKQHQGGVETLDEKNVEATPFEDSPQDNMNSSNIKRAYGDECHPNFDCLFKNESRVRLFKTHIHILKIK